MLKKTILAVALMLHMMAAVPAVQAEIDVPGCFPCGR